MARARVQKDVARDGALLVIEEALPIPRGLEWLHGLPGGSAWLSKLRGLVAGCARDWRLTVHAPIEPGSVSWVAPAELSDGTPAILKLSFPDEETRHEPDALSLWAGRGAVRLYEYDRARHAMLLERCVPGVLLWSIPDEDAAHRIAADILRRLWRAPPAAAPFASLADAARRWSRELPARYKHHGRPFSRRLLDEARSLCVELAGSQSDAVVCHQDFHGGNVLAAEERWLAIDPKPLVGERAFDLASLLRDRRDQLLSAPAPRRVVQRRLDLLSSELGVEIGRARGWGIVHALAWGLTDEAVYAPNIACAELLASC